MLRDEYYVQLPQHLPMADPAHSARLLEKQWRAKIWLTANPYARLLNLNWKKYFRDSAPVIIYTGTTDAGQPIVQRVVK